MCLASQDLFSELVHQVMVSLLLHLNDDHLDERVETREASRQTLSKVLAFYSKTSAFKNVIQTHLGGDQTGHSELKFFKKIHFRRTKTHFLKFSKVQKHIFLTFSKVQKHIFCYFKNGKKLIFAPEKSLKWHFW